MRKHEKHYFSKPLKIETFKFCELASYSAEDLRTLLVKSIAYPLRLGVERDRNCSLRILSFIALFVCHFRAPRDRGGLHRKLYFREYLWDSIFLVFSKVERLYYII